MGGDGGGGGLRGVGSGGGLRVVRALCNLDKAIISVKPDIFEIRGLGDCSHFLLCDCLFFTVMDNLYEYSTDLTYVYRHKINILLKRWLRHQETARESKNIKKDCSVKVLS